MCRLRRADVVYCCARIDLDFFSLFHYVIRWPVLCHYGAQAWVEAAGEQGSALSKIHLRMSPLCLSVHLSVSIYPSIFWSARSLSASLSLCVFHTPTLRVQMQKCKFSPQAQV